MPVTLDHLVARSAKLKDNAVLRLGSDGAVTTAERGFFGKFLQLFRNTDAPGTRTMERDLLHDVRARYGNAIAEQAFGMVRSGTAASGKPITAGQVRQLDAYVTQLSQQEQRQTASDAALRCAPAAAGFGKIAAKAGVPPETLSVHQKEFYMELLQQRLTYDPGGPVTDKPHVRAQAAETLRYVASLDTAAICQKRGALQSTREAAGELVRLLGTRESGSKELAAAVMRFHTTTLVSAVAGSGARVVGGDEIALARDTALRQALDELTPREARERFEEAMSPLGAGRPMLHAAAINEVFKDNEVYAGAPDEVYALARSVKNDVVWALTRLGERGGIGSAENDLRELANNSGLHAEAAGMSGSARAEAIFGSLSQLTDRHGREEARAKAQARAQAKARARAQAQAEAQAQAQAQAQAYAHVRAQAHAQLDIPPSRVASLLTVESRIAGAVTDLASKVGTVEQQGGERAFVETLSSIADGFIKRSGDIDALKQELDTVHKFIRAISKGVPGRAPADEDRVLLSDLRRWRKTLRSQISIMEAAMAVASSISAAAGPEQINRDRGILNQRIIREWVASLEPNDAEVYRQALEAMRPQQMRGEVEAGPSSGGLSRPPILDTYLDTLKDAIDQPRDINKGAGDFNSFRRDIEATLTVVGEAAIPAEELKRFPLQNGAQVSAQFWADVNRSDYILMGADGNEVHLWNPKFETSDDGVEYWKDPKYEDKVDQLKSEAAQAVHDFIGDAQFAERVTQIVHQGMTAPFVGLIGDGLTDVSLPDGTPGLLMANQNDTTFRCALSKEEDGSVRVDLRYKLDRIKHLGTPEMVYPLDAENSFLDLAFSVRITRDAVEILPGEKYTFSLRPLGEDG
ncbi:hypothetical protein [Hyphomicrobium sp. MC1]|uniref:hypothetical protein n=1 Tax=Hyphomicrobium sp. (strain MC1) TaxID=717785 RepID=UPI000213F227|nr:hypothetical protein [Hyphomicrobium sp. MC1]CCB66700.1 protein of unknown function [Hyphomicrobium sp. MC1]